MPRGLIKMEEESREDANENSREPVVTEAMLLAEPAEQRNQYVARGVMHGMTYPNIFVDKPSKDVLKEVINYFVLQFAEDPGLVQIVIAAEQHHVPPKHWHLHGLIRFKPTRTYFSGEKFDIPQNAVSQRLNLRSPRELETQKKHGNYLKPGQYAQRAKGPKYMQWLKYVVKESYFVFHGEDPMYSKALAEQHRRRLFQDLVDGKMEAVDAIQSDARLLLDMDRIEKNLRLYHAAVKHREMKKKFPWAWNADGVPKKYFYFFEGDSGLGKSYAAMNLAKEMFGEDNIYKSQVTPTKQQFFLDGYEGQAAIVFDNVDINYVPPYAILLDLVPLHLNIKNQTVNVKGGSAKYCAIAVFMTSVHSLARLYEDRYDDQIKRRVSGYYVGQGIMSNDLNHVGPARSDAAWRDITDIIKADCRDNGLLPGTISFVNELKRKWAQSVNPVVPIMPAQVPAQVINDRTPPQNVSDGKEEIDYEE